MWVCISRPLTNNQANKKNQYQTNHFSATPISLFAIHVEDLNTQSVNVNLYGGDKVWVVIPMSKYEEVRSLLADKYSKLFDGCPEPTRSKIILITTELFDQYHIPYTTIIQREGEMMFVHAMAYHMGFNADSNIALAVNFCDDIQIKNINHGNIVWAKCVPNLRFVDSEHKYLVSS